MTPFKIICWDLDDTLGSFRDIISARSGGGFPNPEDSYSLRCDIIKTLNRMMNTGCRHVVTSSAKLDYSEKVLKVVCLDAYFEHVLGRNSVTEGIWGKKYAPVAELYNLDEAAAVARMIVIANMPSDEPVDIGIVFVHDRRDLSESALVYEKIVERLWDAGAGDFTKGFEALIGTGKRTTCLDKDFDFVLVSAKIGADIIVDMGYKNSPCTDGLKVPTIMNIRSA